MKRFIFPVFFALISLPLIISGGRAVWQSLPLWSSSPKTVSSLFLVWMIGMVSLGGGGLLLYVSLSALSGRRPWSPLKSADEQWQEGRIVSDGKRKVFGAWFNVLGSLVLFAPILWISVRVWLPHGDPFQWWSLFWAGPLFLSGKAIYKTLQWKKYGASICEIHRKPARAGGELSVRIHPEQVELPAGEGTLDLRCEKREMRGSGKSRRLVVTPIWKDRQTVSIQISGLGLSASFLVPPALPDTEEKGNEGIYWVLEARSTTPGIDYYAPFELAVKRT